MVGVQYKVKKAVHTRGLSALAPSFCAGLNRDRTTVSRSGSIGNSDIRLVMPCEAVLVLLRYDVLSRATPP